MQASNLIQFPNQLAVLEDEAQSALDTSVKALNEFISIIEVIHDSALWQRDYSIWHKFASYKHNFHHVYAQSQAICIATVSNKSSTSCRGSECSAYLSRAKR